MDEARAGDTQPDAGAEQKNVPGSQQQCSITAALTAMKASSVLDPTPLLEGKGTPCPTSLISSVKKVVDSRMTG